KVSGKSLVKLEGNGEKGKNSEKPSQEPNLKKEIESKTGGKAKVEAKILDKELAEIIFSKIKEREREKELEEDIVIEDIIRGEEEEKSKMLALETSIIEKLSEPKVATTNATTSTTIIFENDNNNFGLLAPSGAKTQKPCPSADENAIDEGTKNQSNELMGNKADIMTEILALASETPKTTATDSSRTPSTISTIDFTVNSELKDERVDLDELEPLQMAFTPTMTVDKPSLTPTQPIKSAFVALGTSKSTKGVHKKPVKKLGFRLPEPSMQSVVETQSSATTQPAKALTLPPADEVAYEEEPELKFADNRKEAIPYSPSSPSPPRSALFIQPRTLSEDWKPNQESADAEFWQSIELVGGPSIPESSDEFFATDWMTCSRDISQYHFRWYRAGRICVALNPLIVQKLRTKSNTLGQIYKLYEAKCKDFYKFSQKCGTKATYVYGTEARSLWMPYLWDVRKGIVDQFYKKHHQDICTVGYECPKKICPEVEMAAYYCTTSIVSNKYFTTEVTWAPEHITSGWLKKAESAAREVAQLRAFECPRTLQRITVLTSHYSPWTLTKTIIEKIKGIFDTLIAVERSRDHCLTKIAEDSRKAEIQYRYFASN